MAYGSLEFVQAEFKNITFDAETMITDTEVERFILEADTLIDSRLCLKYKTPITGPQSLVLVRLIETWLVKSRVLSIMRVKSGTEDVDQEGADPGKRATQMLDDLISGKMKLPDAEPVSTSDGIKSYSFDHEIKHVFDVTKTQW
jgi:hypothetical protein